MPQIFLDNIQYNGAPLQEYVAIVRSPNQRFLALRLSDESDENSIQHHKYIITHLESISIVNRIKAKFTELADIQVENELDINFKCLSGTLPVINTTRMKPQQLLACQILFLRNTSCCI